MSKLASHYPEELEIYQSWHDSHDKNEIFESWTLHGVDAQQVELYLGTDVADQYTRWGYYNIK